LRRRKDLRVKSEELRVYDFTISEESTEAQRHRGTEAQRHKVNPLGERKISLFRYLAISLFQKKAQGKKVNK